MENIKVDYKEIELLTGCKFENDIDMILYLQNIIYWIATHNKNYTKEQYNKIIIVKDILESFKF